MSYFRGAVIYVTGILHTRSDSMQKKKKRKIHSPTFASLRRLTPREFPVGGSLAFHNPRQSSLLLDEVSWILRKRQEKRKGKGKKRDAMSGLERINPLGRLIEGARKDFLKYYLKKCPTLFHLCYDPIGTHRKARAFVGFLFGLGAAVVLYEGIIVDLQFDMYTSAVLGAILVAMLSIGCASSIQVILSRPRESACRFSKRDRLEKSLLPFEKTLSPSVLFTFTCST